MVDKLRHLALVLERMNVLYGRVFEVIERERQLLIRMDFDALLEVLREKDEILTAIRALDRDRLRIQDQFAIVFGRKPDDITLKIIGEEIVSQGAGAAELGQRLLALRQTLGGTIEALKEKLAMNRAFIERSVENLRAIAENLTAAVAGRSDPAEPKGGATYTGKARMKETPAKSGSLVEKRL